MMIVVSCGMVGDDYLSWMMGDKKLEEVGGLGVGEVYVGGGVESGDDAFGVGVCENRVDVVVVFGFDWGRGGG